MQHYVIGARGLWCEGVVGPLLHGQCADGIFKDSSVTTTTFHSQPEPHKSKLESIVYSMSAHLQGVESMFGEHEEHTFEITLLVNM